MDFTFSDDQEALRDSVRSFLDDRGMSYVRAMVDDERGFTDDVWRAMTELGWAGLLIPEAHGGLGLDLVDMVVVMEEMGRFPFPGPYFSSSVFATLAAKRLGADDLLGPLASGDLRGTVAIEEMGHGDVVDRVRARSRRKGADWVVSGLKPTVLDGHTADWAIVVARTEDGIGSFLLEAPAAQLVPGLDPTRKISRLDLGERAVRRIGPDGDHTAIWKRVVDDAAVMLAAELVGSCESAHRLAVEYAKVRVQFDRPLSSFQAIRHKAVDMLQQVELARVGTHYAAWTSDVDDPARERAAAMCKGFVGEAAVYVSGEDIQIHGGVGFTWDCDAHFHFKRAKASDVMLGGGGFHRGRLADLVLG
ncbi:MAG TPA: acyl-CoA dehydrogenase family protein [Acidimicrobiia bacterium]|jgi:alkylation response protein AidB-like acyl-CoA dehydrogenase|nr:acyl-CoA dehydrogenase family protein [Acidimicrobiia bacterium]